VVVSVQNILLVAVSVQAENGAPHVAAHAPAVHAAPLSHALPQPPQFAVSVIVSTHVPLHSIPPVPAHEHVPCEQAWSAAQVVPHAPQFSTSELVSTHTSPHRISGGAQECARSTLPHPNAATTSANSPR
jgi:hypothetical protein